MLYGAPERPRVVGKYDEEERPLLGIVGELDSDQIARAIAKRLARKARIEPVEARIQHLDEMKRRPKPFTLARTAFFCSGCPHNRSTVVPEGSVAAAGIGCHGMAMGMDRGIIGVTHMGAEGAQWVGVAPFTETPHLFQNIGDGTFFHSGSLALNYAVASGVNITYKILYNSAVAMTGGQTAAGALAIPALTRRLEAEGVKRTILTTDDPDKYKGVALAANTQVWHRDRLIEAQSVLAAVPGVTVLLHDQQCAAEKRRLRKRGKQAEPIQRVFINERVCEGCGDCGRKSNCLSVQPVDTEFGRKTQIHQSSCNKDYSCLLGDCPSFLTIEPVGPPKKKERRLTPLDESLPEPALKVPAEGFAVHMMGIGGTGVVTVNQILGTAAMLDGKHVRGLDQTGLSQKGGPVVSDLKIASRPLDLANKISTGGADLYLGFDLLVATDPVNLDKAESGRTIAVVSTSRIPTGQMVQDTAVHFPELSGMLMGLDRVTRKDPKRLPRRARHGGGALRRPHGDQPDPDGRRVSDGGAADLRRVHRARDPAQRRVRRDESPRVPVGAHGGGGRRSASRPRRSRPPAGWSRTRVLSAEARAIVDQAGVTGEARRLLEVRVPELIAYQSAAYARQYVDFVRRVAAEEQRRTPGRTGVTEGVARHLFKLMAYKDEYEVARLHLDAAVEAELRARFGEPIRFFWHLHPPLLRALGLKKKLKLGAWFAPAFKALRALRGLRGTPLDVFGYAEIRRVERALVGEYRGLIETALARLGPETHDRAVAIAELPDEIRGLRSDQDGERQAVPGQGGAADRRAQLSEDPALAELGKAQWAPRPRDAFTRSGQSRRETEGLNGETTSGGGRGGDAAGRMREHDGREGAVVGGGSRSRTKTARTSDGPRSSRRARAFASPSPATGCRRARTGCTSMPWGAAILPSSPRPARTSIPATSSTARRTLRDRTPGTCRTSRLPRPARAASTRPPSWSRSGRDRPRSSDPPARRSSSTRRPTTTRRIPQATAATASPAASSRSRRRLGAPEAGVGPSHRTLPGIDFPGYFPARCTGQPTGQGLTRLTIDH